MGNTKKCNLWKSSATKVLTYCFRHRWTFWGQWYNKRTVNRNILGKVACCGQFCWGFVSRIREVTFKHSDSSSSEHQIHVLMRLSHCDRHLSAAVVLSPPSVYISIKQLFLWNFLLNFDQTLHKLCLFSTHHTCSNGSGQMHAYFTGQKIVYYLNMDLNSKTNLLVWNYNLCKA